MLAVLQQTGSRRL